VNQELKHSPVLTDQHRIKSIVGAVGVLGFVVHVALILVFAFLGDTTLAFAELISSITWFLALLCNHRNRTSVAVVLMVAELFFHSALMMFYLGLSPGFQYYLWAGVPFIMFARNLPSWLMALSALAFFTLYSVGSIFAQNIAYPFGYEEYLPWVHTANILISFLALGLTCFYFYQVTKNAEQALLTLAEERLHESNELLERKNQLFAQVSHEIRTPLTLILSPLASLRKNIKDRDGVKTLSLMNQNGQRLLRMVDQLLDLARLDDSSERSSRVINFPSVVKYSFDSFFSLYQQKNIHTSIHLADKIGVNISSDAAEKIIVNLLSNAAKYTPEGGQVIVDCRTQDQQMVLTVSDSGIGIPKEQQSGIFERFVRVQNQETEQIPGVGVGLALVKELVHKYNGNISVKSELGHGSEFKVVFPSQAFSENIIDPQEHHTTAIELEKSALTQTPEASADSTIEQETGSEQKPLVLVIEDHPDMRNYIHQVLASDYQVITAVDGVNGLDTAIEQVPDLIITDFMMPKMNGLKVSQHLRNNLQTSHIPIIMLTAKGDDSTKLVAWKSDIDEYMAKPFDAEGLSARVANLLSIRRLMAKRLSDSSDIGISSALPSANNGVSDKDLQFLDSFKQFVADHYSESDLKAQRVSEHLHMSERQFHRKLKALLEQTFSDYVRHYRLEQGAIKLRTGEPVTKVALDCGFSSQSYFSQCFKAQFGISPKDFGPT